MSQKLVEGTVTLAGLPEPPSSHHTSAATRSLVWSGRAAGGESYWAHSLCPVWEEQGCPCGGCWGKSRREADGRERSVNLGWAAELSGDLCLCPRPPDNTDLGARDGAGDCAPSTFQWAAFSKRHSGLQGWLPCFCRERTEARGVGMADLPEVTRLVGRKIMIGI